MENSRSVMREFIWDWGHDAISGTVTKGHKAVECVLSISDEDHAVEFEFSSDWALNKVDAEVAALERLQGVMDQFYQEAREALLSLKGTTDETPVS